MTKIIKDERIDAYIEKSPEYAKPILKHLRKLVHKGNPFVVETIKWGMPSFDYKGTYVSMAAFKTHVSFGFWKYELLKDTHGYLQARSNKGGDAMGNLGRLLSIKDIPPDEVVLDYIHQAKILNDEGIKMPSRNKAPKPALKAPLYFIKAMSENGIARTNWDGFSASAKNEYIEWLEDAKTDVTRQKRLDTAIEWISENKKRNWKYEKK